MNNFFDSLISIPNFEGMEIQLKLLPTLLLLGAIQGIILSFILFFFKRNKNTTSNRILSIVIFLMAINLLYAVVFTSGIIIKYPQFLRSLDTIQFLSPPLIYIYVLSLTEKNFKLKRFYLLFSLPFIISTIFLVFYIGSIDDRLLFYTNFMKGNIEKSFKVMYFLKVIVGIIFLSLSFKQLSNHIKIVPQLFETAENKTLNWLRRLLFFLLLTWLIVLIRPFINFNINSIYLIGISVSIIIYFITINQLKQQTIYTEIPEEVIENIRKETKSKYKYSQITLEKQSEIFNTFHLYCTTEKPFLKQVCNLNFIAKKIDVKPYIVSQVLNLYAKKTFNEYLNELKVAEVVKNLESQQYNMLTIDAIGELSGFRSKATFYAAFKKELNSTPLQYKKSIEKSNPL